MTLEAFIEHIRAGIIAGAYEVRFTVQFINRHGWHTMRDVPENKRHYVLRYLCKVANA